jgi:hypothetical protein
VRSCVAYLWGRWRGDEGMEAMARGGGRGHDHVLETEHLLRLLPAGGGGPPPDAEDRCKVADRGAPGVPLHRGAVVDGRRAVAFALLEAAVPAEEPARGAAERGGGAERDPGVAGGHRVGAVDVAVAREAEPGGVGAAVDDGRHAGAEVARRGRVRVGHYGLAFPPVFRADSAVRAEETRQEVRALLRSGRAASG